jgi:hypothetical protein
MRVRVSIFTPKTFSKRIAISPDKSPLPFSKVDSAGLDTPNADAAADTVNPAASTISVLRKAPG